MGHPASHGSEAAACLILERDIKRERDALNHGSQRSGKGEKMKHDDLRLAPLLAIHP